MVVKGELSGQAAVVLLSVDLTFKTSIDRTQYLQREAETMNLAAVHNSK